MLLPSSLPSFTTIYPLLDYFSMVTNMDSFSNILFHPNHGYKKLLALHFQSIGAFFININHLFLCFLI